MKLEMILKNKTGLIACAITIIFFLGPKQTQAQGSKTSPRKIAFVIGVSKYQKRGLSSLDFAHKDGRDMANILSANGFEVTQLIAEDSKLSQFRKEWKGFLSKATSLGKNDVVLFYFSGHGLEALVPDPVKKVKVESPFLCVFDTLVSDPSTMISLNQVIADLIEKSGSSNNLLVVDACRSSSGSKSLDGNTTKLPSGICLLLSCSTGQESFEHPSLKQGIFTSVLLEGLKGKATLDKNVVDWVTLVAFTIRRVSDRVKKLKGNKFEQKPNLIGYVDNSPVLSKLQKAKRIRNSIGMNFLLIPKESADEFYLGETEVTQSQFERIMGINPSAYSKQGEAANRVQGLDRANSPVENVTWNQAVEFCRRLSKMEKDSGRRYRLPTRSEWLAATEKPSKAKFKQQVWHSRNTRSENPPKPYPQSVGTSQPNRYGVYDILGNVWEWCDSEATEAQYPYCGGCFLLNESMCQPQSKVFEDPGFRSRLVGFRVLMELK